MNFFSRSHLKDLRGYQLLFSTHAEGNAMATVSVFGGTGFLGRRLVRRLASEGTTVRV